MRPGAGDRQVSALLRAPPLAPPPPPPASAVIRPPQSWKQDWALDPPPFLPPPGLGHSVTDIPSLSGLGMGPLGVGPQGAGWGRPINPHLQEPPPPEPSRPVFPADGSLFGPSEADVFGGGLCSAYEFPSGVDVNALAVRLQQVTAELQSERAARRRLEEQLGFVQDAQPP